MVIDALKEFGMPGAYLLDDYGERRAAMEHAAFPTLADEEGRIRAAVREDGRASSGTTTRCACSPRATTCPTASDDPSKKKMRPEMITRLLTRRLG